MNGHLVRVKGDPHWTSCKYGARCKICDNPIKPGDRMFYYPRSKSCYCETHGRAAETDFNTMAEMDNF